MNNKMKEEKVIVKVENRSKDIENELIKILKGFQEATMKNQPKKFLPLFE